MEVISDELKAQGGLGPPVGSSTLPAAPNDLPKADPIILTEGDEEVRARLAAIVESSDDAIISKTLQGTIRTWNAGAERLFGYTAAEAIGRSVTMLIPTERLDEERQILARLTAGQRIEHYETVRLTKEGREVDVSLTVSPIRDGEGKIVGASKIARDVTEQKWANEALRASEERFRTLTAHAPVGIFVTDREGACEFVNERWCEMAGLRPQDALGLGWVQAIHIEDRARVSEEWNAASQEGRPFAGEYRFRTPQGKVTWLEGNAVALSAPSGEVVQYLGTVSDITERRAANEKLREADRRKDDFVALLAHELRNPLAPLRNGLWVMRLAPDDAEAVAKSREMMERQLAHMVRLVDDLLDVSRINRNKMELRRTRMPIADVVANAVETARPAIEAAGHELTVTLPGEPVHLDGDLTRLAQIFANLLNNSAKYTQPGGHIHLRARREGDQVVVAVEDDGIGIAPVALPILFEIFNQADGSIERTNSGLGIGLALVKGLVEMHGGTVAVASPGLGLGSTFTVRLPAIQDQEVHSASTASPDAVNPGAAPLRILVVDDNRDSAISMAMMLRLLGNEVHLAHDGLEAVKAAEELRPQVVLMDIGMPNLNGYEATRRIREQPWGQEIKIIALTAWSGQEVDAAKSKIAGCDAHLVKPVNLTELQEVLAGLREVAKA